MGNYITYFKESIKSLDIKKAKDILLDLHLESETTKIAVLNEMAMVEDEMAWVLLDFVIRLETLYYHSCSVDTYDKLIQLVIDRAHLNFEFAIILYKSKDRKKILRASPLIKYILTNCTDREILFETINVVGNEEIESLAPAIAEFLYYDDSTLKERAVKNLAKFASPEVYKIFYDISKTVKNDQNIMDVLNSFKIDSKAQAKTIQSSSATKTIQSSSATEQNLLSPITEQNLLSPITEQNLLSPITEQNLLSPITEQNLLSPITKQKDINLLASQSIEERFDAFNYFSKSGSNYIKELIGNLKSQNHDLLVNTFRIISYTTNEDILPNIYSFLNKKGLNSSLEHEAFETLLSFDKFSFTELMMGAIEKTALHVRMSAIKALNKNYNDPVYAKIKNRIETGREQGELLVQTIIDARAENLINYLLVSDTFADMASTYLIKDATPSALNNYLNILTKRGLKSTAKKIEFKADMGSKLKNRLKAMIISSSDTTQKIYEKLLFKNGYISIGFESPEDAFESLSIDKPDIIVSELFAKDMTGLDFAKEVREFYNKNELPFIISTRQNDFLNLNFKENYVGCDINGIFKFPEIMKGIKNGL